ncbi:MAG: hypothetical protein V9G19_14020 [Tetrasphaera sp.]
MKRLPAAFLAVIFATFACLAVPAVADEGTACPAATPGGTVTTQDVNADGWEWDGKDIP